MELLGNILLFISTVALVSIWFLLKGEFMEHDDEM